MINESLPTIVVVGAGFGGMKVASELRKTQARVILLSKRNYHLFQPLLYQVATAGLSQAEIAHPVRAILRGQRNLEFRLAEVTGADLASCKLFTSAGEILYDYVVFAIGSEVNYFGLETVEENGFVLKDLDDATAIRNHLLSMFELAMEEPDAEKRRELHTFVVAGGGPTGVESSGAISELIRLALIRDYSKLNINEIRVLLLEATTDLLIGFPEKLRKAAAETLWHKHVEVRFGAAVTEFDGRRVVLKSGEVIPARTLIWAAGAKAEKLAENLDLPKARNNRLSVDPTLRVPGYQNVFVIGDAAYLEEDGRPLPMMAPVAIQQGKLAARNIRHIMAGESPEKFCYKDPGSLATIGRNEAVARIGRLTFSGFLAWLIWLLVHIYWLIGFRNRLLVLINWAWDYIFYERAALLIEPEKEKESILFSEKEPF